MYMWKTRNLKFFMIITAFSALLSACTNVLPGAQGADPFEKLNRKTHEFNKNLDRNFLGPVSSRYSSVLPDPIENSVNNFASNLRLPGKVANNILQLDLYAAVQNTSRFFVNSTVGIAGFFDPSGKLGITVIETDFGETLEGWGVGEGAYIELPLLGPSNLRDSVGRVVDAVLLDPVDYILVQPEANYRTAADLSSLLQTRDALRDQINSLFNESADSYAQARLIYLQNRRFKLEDVSSETYFDPYEDFE